MLQKEPPLEEDLQNKKGIANSDLNIGDIYAEQNKFPEALNIIKAAWIYASKLTIKI
jgi:hypothetical protein